MVVIKDLKFDVEIERKKIRNIYLRVKGNTLKVTAPIIVPEYRIYNFIENKKAWIYKTYQKSLINRETKLYKGDDSFYIFGKKYNLVLNEGKDNIKIIDDTIYLTYHDLSDNRYIDYLYKCFDKELFKRSCIAFDKYEEVLRNYGYNRTPEIVIKKMKSKWGVCFPKKNKIGISSYLIHYPLECLDYIMLHELVHFIMPNHSKRFYDIVSYYMNDYKKVNALLK